MHKKLAIIGHTISVKRMIKKLRLTFLQSPYCLLFTTFLQVWTWIYLFQMKIYENTQPLVIVIVSLHVYSIKFYSLTNETETLAGRFATTFTTDLQNYYQKCGSFPTLTQLLLWLVNKFGRLSKEILKNFRLMLSIFYIGVLGFVKIFTDLAIEWFYNWCAQICLKYWIWLVVLYLWKLLWQMFPSVLQSPS